jgi:hypothetical protein
MKRLMFISFVLFSLASCKKETKITADLATVMSASYIKPDTIPDGARLGIRLFRDSVIYDGFMLGFNHKASVNYIVDEDAPYFMGYGDISLASISGDDRDLAINTLPYTPGMAIGLDVHARTSGVCFLEVNYKKQIPANIQVWIRDTYLKDSANISNKNYSFNIIKADTNSLGNKRFKIILKSSANDL